MRGTQTNWLHGRMLRGIIPAYAGNTCAGAAVRRCCGDHPRVCGEHGGGPFDASVGWGSSPRMRGTLGQGAGGGDVRGIIPAYAGNTNHLLERWRVHRDHPRVCGEHRGERRFLGECRGSSPRMRGTLSGNIEEVGERGIIPAYAGNTPRHGSSPACRRDHPRVCGEHTALHQRCAGPLGSSPRMRGTRPARRTEIHPRGIIPAYAGNTCRTRSPRQCARDHPRVCGEHIEPMDRSDRFTGSSPRMRGTLLRWSVVFRDVGIIPAYAGNTLLIML